MRATSRSRSKCSTSLATRSCRVASTFRFLALNADRTTTRLATPAEESGGAYVLRVHVDNNNVRGRAAPAEHRRRGGERRVRVPPLRAGRPGACPVPGGTSQRPCRVRLRNHPWIQWDALGLHSGSLRRGGGGERSHGHHAVHQSRAATTSATSLRWSWWATCVNAAFAASLGVYGKAFDGVNRLGLDASKLIAFALAELEPEPE